MSSRTVLGLAALLACGAARAAPAAGSGGAAAFRDLCGRLAADAEAGVRIAVAGRDGWLFLTGELRHVGAGPFWGAAAASASRARRPDQADPLPVLLDVHRQLSGMGIDLIVVPVPPKASIYPDKVEGGGFDGPPAERIDADLRAFHELLRGAGLRTLDLAPLFLDRRRGDDSEAKRLYCRQDSHWSVDACALAARQLAGELASREWAAAVPRMAVEIVDDEIEVDGDLRPAFAEPRPPRERLPVRRVLAGGKPVAPDRASPVLLLGDSHALVFHAGGDMHTAGAGLADHLAAELGFAVDVLGVRGSGATPARVALYRRARADPSYLDGKKAVIWCFAAREFTESDGWAMLPLR